MLSFHTIRAYLKHWLLRVDHHSIHSPYFFDFYNRVLNGRSDESKFTRIEDLRHSMLSDSTMIEVEDLGSGAGSKPNRRSLSEITRTSSSPPDLAQFYVRILSNMKARRIIELGSSVGITTLYLAQQREVEVITFEGSHGLANVALTNFESMEQKNIHLIEGNITSTLPDFLQNPAKVNFVLMDANHEYEPTVRYFNFLLKRLDEDSIVVVDDIHRSTGMEKAWDEIKAHPVVYGSADLFRCGILFFDPALNHQHFVWSLN